jgi:hypothetical protein
MILTNQPSRHNQTLNKKKYRVDHKPIFNNINFMQYV